MGTKEIKPKSEENFMNTDEIVRIALDLVEMNKLPADSAVYVAGENITKILYGIDISVAELLFAKDKGFDCVIAHHPVGLIDHWKVFQRHLLQMESKNIPKEKAQEIIDKKMLSFKFRAHAGNYDAIPSVARLIDMPFLNIHCPSDELGRRMISNSVEEFVNETKEPSLNELIIYLETKFTEFQKAKTKIELAKGRGSDPLGNWIFSHGAFTNGGFDIANCYYEHGVDTVIYIHISPYELSKILNLDYGRLIITGHLASDSIGINPFIDQLIERGMEITWIGGLIR